MENSTLVNFLILAALLALLAMLLAPFYLMNKKTAHKAGLNRLALAPGYRRYTLSIPENYTGDQPVPLILVLHYAGHGTPYYGELILTSLVEPAFRELGAIIAAPDCPDFDWTQPKSEQLLLDLLADLKGRFNLDPRRILLTGYSLGGIGTWHLAARHPEGFTAAIIMAGRPLAAYQTLNWHLPLMVIHGRNDELMPLQPTKEAVIWLEEQGVDIQLRILEGVSHYETHYFEVALRNTIPWLLDRWAE